MRNELDALDPLVLSFIVWCATTIILLCLIKFCYLFCKKHLIPEIIPQTKGYIQGNLNLILPSIFPQKVLMRNMFLTKKCQFAVHHKADNEITDNHLSPENTDLLKKLQYLLQS